MRRETPVMDVQQTVTAADRSLLEQLYPRLRRFAAAAAPWDVEPDDLLQEALTRTIARGPLSRLDHPAAYLRKAMIHLASNHHHHQTVRRSALARVAASEAQPANDHYPSDLAVLSELPPRSRSILYLAEVEGHSYDEIASALDCSASAARMAAMRGRRKLRQSLRGGAT
ncbi:MAG: RNA polymerase sigma factor [Acidimicrobiia bacterium]|nr:RNA polymerase sigma factor [Acidimicrobiia bacterium]